MKALILTLLVGIGTAFAQQTNTQTKQTKTPIYKTLPIGTEERVIGRFTETIKKISVYLFDASRGSWQSEWPEITKMAFIPYSKTDGDLRTLMMLLIQTVLEALPGHYTEDNKFLLRTEADTGTIFSNVLFRLERQADGSLQAPARLLEIPWLLEFGGEYNYRGITDPYLGTWIQWLPIDYPGWKTARLWAVDKDGEWVPWDLWPPDAYICGGYWESGIILLPTGLMTGKWLRENNYTGTLTIYMDDRQVSYDKYDILSGQLIEQVSLPVVSIRPAPAANGVEVTIQAKPGTALTIERSYDLKRWEFVRILFSNAQGVVSYTDPAPISPVFYRASHKP